MKKKIVIIGAGYAGASLARLFNDRAQITVLESAKRPGGLCKSYYKEGMVYEYGPHILANHHCSDEAIAFILKHIDCVETGLTSASYVKGKFTYYPPHQKNAEILGIKEIVEQEWKNLPHIPNEENFETYLIDKVGKTFYEIYFKDFTEKFWGIAPKTMSAEWAKMRHLGESLKDEKMFFNKRWCAYPKSDWNELFKNLLQEINVIYDALVSKVDLEKKEVILDSGTTISYDMLISTMSIDKLFGYPYGKLKYSGYEIEPVILERDYYGEFNSKPISMTYFPEKDHIQARITDYKSFQKKETLETYQGRTIITIEKPSHKQEFYPSNDSENAKLLEKYLELAATHKDVITFGRKGLYKYLTTDTTTEMALRLEKYFPDWQQLDVASRLDAYNIVRGNWNN